MVNEVSSQGLDALLAEHLKGVIMSRLVTQYYCIFFSFVNSISPGGLHVQRNSRLNDFTLCNRYIASQPG